MSTDNFLKNFDSIVFFTFSNWKNEMVSNRFHYVTRFLKHLPVYFIEAKDVEEMEISQDGEITLITLPITLTNKSIKQLSNYLAINNINSPLLWIYNPYFYPYTKQLPFFKVYHATEDYLCSDFTENQSLQKFTKLLIEDVNSVITVSDGIKENILEQTKTYTPITSVGNGVDYNFWCNKSYPKRNSLQVVYQGGIHRKLDFELLEYIAKNNPEVTFVFCGEEEESKGLLRLKRLKNTIFHGKLELSKVKEICNDSTIGLIPFVKNDWITNRSYPLKFFEYLTSGLEVISTPINALNQFDHHYHSATNKEEFDAAIKRICHQKVRKNTKETLSICHSRGYDNLFSQALQALSVIYKSTFDKDSLLQLKKNIAVLYDHNSVHVNTISEHIDSFERYSNNNFYYISTSDTENGKLSPEDLDLFDVVIVHYSVRIFYTPHLNETQIGALTKTSTLKVLFIQDEYDDLPLTHNILERIQFDIIFTCVPTEQIKSVYPDSRFQNTLFYNNLTGYIHPNLKKQSLLVNSEKKEILVFYRGRKLPVIYGQLGIEKQIIGDKFKELCLENNINNIDIETSDTKRIYGNDWLNTLARSEATLATESGCNVFDFSGTIKSQISEAEAKGLTYDNIYESIVKPHDNIIKMNQLSPKFFEAMMLDTVLILFEGKYQGYLEKDRHYIELKKDFSNFNEVIVKLNDKTLLSNIRKNCKNEIIGNKELHYKHFIQNYVFKKINLRMLHSSNLGAFKSTIKIKSSIDNECFQTIYSPKDNSLFTKIIKQAWRATQSFSMIIENFTGIKSESTYSFAKKLYRTLGVKKLNSVISSWIRKRGQ